MKIDSDKRVADQDVKVARENLVKVESDILERSGKTFLSLA